MLSSQMSAYNPVEERNYISLTEGGPNTTVEIKQRDISNRSRPMLPGPSGARYSPYRTARFTKLYDENSDKVGFWTLDENTIWDTSTDIEIFCLKHDNNGDGVYTVVTSDGEKVFAPGTENDYSFTLKNTNTVSLDYILSVEAFVKTEVEDVEYWLPIQGRLYNHADDVYLAGSADEWPDVLELDGVSESGVIAAGNIKDYTLQWRWPFERGDQIQEGLYKGDYTEDFYDTKLGNLAVDNDLELHIIIRTSAWIDEEPTEPGGDTPPTGDTHQAAIWIVIAVIAAIGLVCVLIVGLRDGKKKNDEREG